MSRISLLGIFFLAGGLFGAFGLQPIRFMVDGLMATRTLAQEMMQERSELLAPIVHAGTGVTLHEAGRAGEGLTLLQGLLPGGPQVRLVDMRGNELHRWEIDFFEAWEDPDHIVPQENVPKSDLNYHTQGFAVDPDGSLLATVGGKGAIRMDRCGNILWTIDRMIHHAVLPAPDGGYWLPSHWRLDEAPERLLPPGLSREVTLEAVGREGNNSVDTVLKVDAEGRPEKEFVILDAILDAGLEAALHDVWRHTPVDPTHLNDIELVTPALARRIPAAEPGDLLVSLRNMNMLAVLDQDDGALKWHKRGPWVRQHDPDITPDGLIEVFNNRSPRLYEAEGRPVVGSQIVAFDPASEQTAVLHPQGEADRFRSVIMGSHQRLPNGNRLIVESKRGRVFEVTSDGDVVWSLVLPYDSTHAALIEDARRVPADYFTVEDWTCDGAQS